MDAVIKQAVREELRRHLDGRRRKLGVLGKLGNFGESVSEVFNSEFSILLYTQNEKLGDENLGVLFQAFTKLRVLPTPSFPFCTIPKTENLEMKTLECSFKHFYQTPSFPFCTILKTENLEMKTSECSFKPFYQTPSFSNSEFSILRYTQNGKLGVGNLGVFSKVYQNSDLFNYLIKFRGFPTPSFPFCTTLKTDNSEMENLGV